MGLGFTSSKVDPSLFLFNSTTVYIMVLIYMNDILNIGNDDIAIQALIDHLNCHISFVLIYALFA